MERRSAVSKREKARPSGLPEPTRRSSTQATGAREVLARRSPRASAERLRSTAIRATRPSTSSTAKCVFHVDGAEHTASGGRHRVFAAGRPARIHGNLRNRTLPRPQHAGTHDRYFRDGGEPATHQDFNAAPAPDHQRMEASTASTASRSSEPPPFAAPESASRSPALCLGAYGRYRSDLSDDTFRLRFRQGPGHYGSP